MNLPSEPMPEPMSEPWMRGHLADLHPVIAAVLYALEQAREDLTSRTASLTHEQLWRSIGAAAPVGYHLRHVAGSVDRLITYAAGASLDDAQLQTLKAESDRDLMRAALLEAIRRSFDRAEQVIRAADPADFSAPRFIGRKRIPTTFAGLLIHIAEHTQRHVGAAIATAKIVSGHGGNER